MGNLLNDNSRTFIFYPSWLMYVDGVDGVEKKYKMLYAIIEYGCSGDHTPVDDMMIENTFQYLVRPVIDKAQGRYQQRVDFGQNVGRHRIAQEDLIAEYAAQGLRGNEIADKLGITPSAVYKTDAWKNRDKDIPRVKKKPKKEEAEPQDFTAKDFVF